MESAAGPPVTIATFTGETADPTPSTTAAATDAAAADHSSASAAASQLALVVPQCYQYLLDKSTPFVLYRWIAFTVIAIVYLLRVFLLQGFFVVTYGLGIYILNILIGFLSPRVDPGIEDGPTLPTRRTEEFRPFVRRLPEFKFWYSITKAFCIAFALTFFWIFDVPVYWPILLFYFVILFTLTMKRQILHMIQYNYVPFSTGKKRYEGKKESTSESAVLLPED